MISVSTDTIDTIGWEAWRIDIDTIQHILMRELFKGKHKSNNREVLRLLLVTPEPLSRSTIARRLRMKKTTVHDRIEALIKKGLVEKKGERPAEKNKQPNPLWGLAPFGLWVAAHELGPDGLDKCRTIILDYWKKFTEIYELKKPRSEKRAYRLFTEWLESDDGLLEFLDTYGSLPLEGESAAIATFHWIIDIALLRRHGVLLQTMPGMGVEYGWLISNEKNPYWAIGEMASKHESFSKLDHVLREVHAPLLEYQNNCAYKELVERLRLPLGKEVSEKLAATPFLIKRKMSDIGVSLENLSFLSSDSLYDFGTRITMREDKVSIESFDPDTINPEWKEYCELYVIQEGGKKIKTIPARRELE